MGDGMSPPDFSSGMRDTFFQLAAVPSLLNKPASSKGVPASGSSLLSVTDGFKKGIKSGT